jgi:single-strand DNA-binding protein
MQTTITGNLTRDPELRFTPGGQATVAFAVAATRGWTDRFTNERKEQTSFFDVVAWGTLAENVAHSLRKGDRVVVAGRLDQRTWETQEGERRSKVEIVADEVAPSLRWATAQVTKNDRPVAQAGQRPEAVGDASLAPLPSAQRREVGSSGGEHDGTARWQDDASRGRGPQPAADVGPAPVATAESAALPGAPAPAPMRAAAAFDDEEPF